MHVEFVGYYQNQRYWKSHFINRKQLNYRFSKVSPALFGWNGRPTARLGKGVGGCDGMPSLHRALLRSSNFCLWKSAWTVLEVSKEGDGQRSGSWQDLPSVPRKTYWEEESWHGEDCRKDTEDKVQVSKLHIQQIWERVGYGAWRQLSREEC